MHTYAHIYDIIIYMYTHICILYCIKGLLGHMFLVPSRSSRPCALAMSRTGLLQERGASNFPWRIWCLSTGPVQSTSSRRLCTAMLRSSNISGLHTISFNNLAASSTLGVSSKYQRQSALENAFPGSGVMPRASNDGCAENHGVEAVMYVFTLYGPRGLSQRVQVPSKALPNKPTFARKLIWTWHRNSHGHKPFKKDTCARNGTPSTA